MAALNKTGFTEAYYPINCSRWNGKQEISAVFSIHRERSA